MPPKKKAANGYKFAEPLPPGTLLESREKKVWRLGGSIGKGGFGAIYSAQEEGAKSKDYPYVVKVEPHANGPLFVEINFYIKFAKPAVVASYQKENNIDMFGMPLYYGSGSLDYKGEKYRFLVMKKFSTDLFKLLEKNGNKFPIDTVFKIGSQMVDVLEYLHSCGYVHADLKPANILLGATKGTANKQCYLVDFGLACRYTTEKVYKPNPKKAHDGTIEYLSRDAHQGVQTRRGDLEVLAYNLIKWLGGTLPWESNLKDPKIVQTSKEQHMKSPQKILDSCFENKSYPKALLDYLTYLNTLLFNTEPDYKFIKTIFHSGIKEAGSSLDSPLNFSHHKTPTKGRGAGSSKPAISSTDPGEAEAKSTEVTSTKRNRRKNAREVSPVQLTGNDTPVSNRTRKRRVAIVQEEELPVNSLTAANQNRSSTTNGSIQRKVKRISKSLQDLSNLEPPAGYTEAMKEIWKNKAIREANKKVPVKPKKVLPKEPQASTSRARRVGRRNPPLNHLDVVNRGSSSSED